MPYIDPKVREIIDKNWVFYPATPGILNYMFTKLLTSFLGSKPNYERFNSAVGALECAKQELYRRMVAPYEDKKIEENGDVY